MHSRLKEVIQKGLIVRKDFKLDGGGGGGVIYLITSFIRGGSAPRSNPLPYYILFLTEKITLSHAFGSCKWYTIHIPSLEFYIHLTALQFIKIVLN